MCGTGCDMFGCIPFAKYFVAALLRKTVHTFNAHNLMCFFKLHSKHYTSTIKFKILSFPKNTCTCQQSFFIPTFPSSCVPQTYFLLMHFPGCGLLCVLMSTLRTVFKDYSVVQYRMFSFLVDANVNPSFTHSFIHHIVSFETSSFHVVMGSTTLWALHMLCQHSTKELCSL